MNIHEIHPRAGAEPATAPTVHGGRRDRPNSGFNSRDGGQQHALHVTDYYLATTLTALRVLGVCNRSAGRKLSDDEFDDNQESLQNGDGEIY